MSEFRTHDLLLSAELAGLRLDQALARALPQYSRARIQGWIDRGAVRLEGRVPRAREKVLGGERVRIEARLEPEGIVAPEALPLEIVHEDRDLLVIDKPPGLVVHPGAGNRAHTLQNALLAYDRELARVPRAGLVHRLDRGTSGLLVVARTVEAHAFLVAALAAREVERRYLAIATGAMTGGRTIDEPIGRHRTLRTRMAVVSAGRAAVTHVRVLRRFRAHTLVEARLETGRTHQIRVHLAHIGHPVLGDPVYAGRRRVPAGASAALLETLGALGRQALHAASLRLIHPRTGTEMSFAAPLPDDMQRVLEALEVDTTGVAAKTARRGARA